MTEKKCQSEPFLSLLAVTTRERPKPVPRSSFEKPSFLNMQRALLLKYHQFLSAKK